MNITTMAAVFGLSALCLGAALPVSAFAADEAANDTRSGRLSACKADMEKLCSGAERRARWSCLQSNEAKLSSDCKTALTRIQDARAKVTSACKTDTETLCGAESGRRAFSCLRKNEPKLSADCSTALAAMPSRKNRGTDAGTTDGDIEN